MQPSSRENLEREFQCAVRTIIQHFSESERAPEPELLSRENGTTLLEQLQASTDVLKSEIDLSGDEQRFSATIFASRSSMRALGDSSNLLDWIGELANMVMGGLKNRLTAYGMDCKISLPTSHEIGSCDAYTVGDSDVFLTVALEGSDAMLFILSSNTTDDLSLASKESEVSLKVGQVMFF